ncbi:hypothetical protein [Calothrix sp. PCC 6303]|nr:hypothetical protein Cal6303_5268 [Calothrix sp. PCC 6303]
MADFQQLLVKFIIEECSLEANHKAALTYLYQCLLFLSSDR